MNSKESIRKEIKILIKSKSKEELENISSKIVDKLFKKEEIQKANSILCYYPILWEVDIIPLIKELSRSDKKILLPRLIWEEFIAVEIEDLETDLKAGKWGINQPKHLNKFKWDIDIAIIPWLAFSTDGKRLGKWLGYYDRFLAKNKHILKYWVCFPFQIINDIPIEDHDVRMDEVIFWIL